MYTEDAFTFALRYISALSISMFLSFAGLLAGPYVMLKVRDWRAGSRDRQLGIKVALHFLITQAVWTFFTGLTLVAVHIVDFQSVSTMASGTGLMVAGAVITCLLFLALRRTNDEAYLAVRRTYFGLRLVFAWSIAIAAFTFFAVHVFEVFMGTAASLRRGYVGPNISEEMTRGAVITCVWTAAGLLDYFLLRRTMKRPEVPPFEDTCVSCDYQLVGTILSSRSRCPECGTPIPADQARVVYEMHRPAEAHDASTQTTS